MKTCIQITTITTIFVVNMSQWHDHNLALHLISSAFSRSELCSQMTRVLLFIHYAIEVKDRFLLRPLKHSMALISRKSKDSQIIVDLCPGRRLRSRAYYGPLLIGSLKLYSQNIIFSIEEICQEHFHRLFGFCWPHPLRV